MSGINMKVVEGTKQNKNANEYENDYVKPFELEAWAWQATAMLYSTQILRLQQCKNDIEKVAKHGQMSSHNFW